MDSSTPRELDAVEEDELVDLAEQGEVARVREEVGLHDRDPLALDHLIAAQRPLPMPARIGPS